MRLQPSDSGGSADAPVYGPGKPLKAFVQQSSSLPFGQTVPLESIGGPTYLTTQTLIQQVAYCLSDRLWTYSPETFGLDVAVRAWLSAGAPNSYGHSTNVESMQIRHGAASIALGYVFSKDFDLKKRYTPQSIIASSASLLYLRSALNQLSLFYSVANPFVAHVAAIDYAGGSSALVTDYVSALDIAEELGLGLVASFSTYESQHMALFTTLLANIIPTIHIYDGVQVGRETSRVIDVLDQGGLYQTYKSILYGVKRPDKSRAGLDTEVEHLLSVFNEELGTEYGLFEYHGHASPDSVIIAFGTVESSLASQTALSLEQKGAKVGVMNVRVYRPFLEEHFLRLMPISTKKIGVLGQVKEIQDVGDTNVHSGLYNDVKAAVTFSDIFLSSPMVVDIKYTREQVWTPVSIAAAFQLLEKKPVLETNSLNVGQHEQANLPLLDLAGVQQYTFWDMEDSPSVNAPLIFGSAISRDSAANVTTKSNYDDLIQGGLVRTDIRKSRKTIEAPYSIEAADLVYVGDERLLISFDIVGGLKAEGKILLKMPGVKDDELEKKLPDSFKRSLFDSKAQLYVLDPSAIESVMNDSSLETYLVQLSFLRTGLPGLEKVGLEKLASINGSLEIFRNLAESLKSALRKVEIPENWATLDLQDPKSVLPRDLTINSFVPFDKIEHEPPTYLRDWKTAAKGLVFKEAYGSKSILRPDLTMKTYTVHVKENRRLTPSTYDRNIFHIEFDLGKSGLTYEIGEALGIHAENDELEVEEFIRFYKLDPGEIVEVPSREDPAVLENRTVWQALMQNVDIFGRPPKRFYEALAEFAENTDQKKELQSLGGLEGQNEFQRRAEVDTITYADVLLEFSSAHPSFHEIVRIVNPMKRREYSIASCQKVTPNSVALMIVVVGWTNPNGRNRWGQATRYLSKLRVGAPITVSVKPSVMKLPPRSTQPLIMAGLGTGLAPFRAFVQHRAWEKAQGKEIGSVLLYMGSRHQREEYCYGEEWEAYQDAGVITLLGRAFSRDQPQKIYIQDRMRQTMGDIIQAYLKEEGAFYLCVSHRCLLHDCPILIRSPGTNLASPRCYQCS